MSVSDVFEEPRYFRAGRHDLFGVVTRPLDEPNGLGVLLLLEGGRTPAVGRNGVAVRIARQLAAQGCTVLRFDYHGIGESAGPTRPYRLDLPYVADAVAAAEVLRACDEVAGTTMVGACFGARTALAAADRLPDLRGVALLAVPARTGGPASDPEAVATGAAARGGVAALLRGLRDPRRRAAYRAALHARAAGVRPWSWARDSGLPHPADRGVDRAFLAGLRGLHERGVPTLLAYGRDDPYYADVERALPGTLRTLVGDRSDVGLVVVDGTLHGMTSVRAQEGVRALLDRWLEVCAGASQPVPHVASVREEAR